MREIKFRAWFDGHMYEVAKLDFWGDPNQASCDLAGSDEDGKLAEIFDIYLGEVELMQYTGLKDKNGVEIYDGDILKIQTSDFYSKKITDEYIGQICFSRGGFFVLTDGHHTNFCLWGKSTATMVVIGNIYENIDLLEVEE